MQGTVTMWKSSLNLFKTHYCISAAADVWEWEKPQTLINIFALHLFAYCFAFIRGNTRKNELIPHCNSHSESRNNQSSARTKSKGLSDFYFLACVSVRAMGWRWPTVSLNNRSTCELRLQFCTHLPQSKPYWMYPTHLCEAFMIFQRGTYWGSSVIRSSAGGYEREGMLGSFPPHPTHLWNSLSCYLSQTVESWSFGVGFRQVFYDHLLFFSDPSDRIYDVVFIYSDSFLMIKFAVYFLA